MTIKITRYGSRYLAFNKLNENDLKLRLYTNTFTPSYNKASMACFTQPPYASGYTSNTIATGDWFYSYDSGSPSTDFTAKACHSASASCLYIFTFNGAQPTLCPLVRGYFVTAPNWPATGNNTVLWVEQFGQPFTVSSTAADHIDIPIEMEIGE